MIALSCPVRGCGQPLAREERTLRCKAGHAHDVSKHGHVNLLQPQDKRSTDPGDRKDAVLARRRTAERGLTRDLVRRLGEIGYAGAVAVELMNPQLWGVPPRQFGEIAITALRKLLGQAEH